jgi:exopolysaccharide production protein ExoZ
MRKLPNIQILRAIAALTVVLYHVGIEATSVCTGTSHACSYDLMFGVNGVALFFMISGFIMVTTSWNSFAMSSAPRDFMRRRIARIVPLYWLVTSLAVVGAWFVPSMLNVPVMDPVYIAASYLFWPVARVNGLVRPIANLGWTLNLEMFFYAVFALALLFKRRLGLVLAIGILAAICGLQVSGLFSAGGIFASVQLNFWADPIILNFTFGMLIGAIFMLGQRVDRLTSLALLAASTLAVGSYLNIYDAINGLVENSLSSRIINAFPVLILFIAGALGPQVDMRKIHWRALLLLGDASYSLYLIHPFALRGFRGLWVKLIGAHLPVWSSMATGLTLALAAGRGTYFLFERPMTRFFSRTKGPKAKASFAVLAT